MLPSAITVKGVVLIDQVKSLDWQARKASFECKTPSYLIAEVLGKLNMLLGPGMVQE